MQDFDKIHPIYYIGNYEEKLINNIEKNLGFILVNDDNKKTNLKIKSRVRSIHSSLAIEANSLSLNNVEDIVKDKKVLGKRKEIQEVINANLVYERIKEFNWKEEFEYIPFEEEIYLNQKKYYDAIAECHINGNANSFIKFMLKVINNTLEKTTQKTTQKNNIKLSKNQKEILKLIQKNPNITRKEIADFINITNDGVKYHLKKLIDRNIIKRVGPANGGYWEIVGVKKN